MVFEDIAKGKTTIDKDYIELVLKNIETVVLQKNDLILKQGQVENYIYYLESGITRFWKSKGKKQVTCFLAFPGEYASSYESFKTKIPSLINHQCISDVKLLRISQERKNK